MICTNLLIRHTKLIDANSDQVLSNGFEIEEFSAVFNLPLQECQLSVRKKSKFTTHSYCAACKILLLFQICNLCVSLLWVFKIHTLTKL